MSRVVKYDKRTANAIRKADALPQDISSGIDDNLYDEYSEGGNIYNYGNTYVVKIIEALGNGIYKSALVSDLDKLQEDPTKEIKYINIATFDMALGDAFMVNEIIQVTEANIKYANYKGTSNE